MITSLDKLIEKMERTSKYCWKLYLYKDYRTKEKYEEYLEGEGGEEGKKVVPEVAINALRTAVDSMENSEGARWYVEIQSTKNSNGDSVLKQDMTKTGAFVPYSSASSSSTKTEPKATESFSGLGMLGQLEMSRLNGIQEDLRNEKNIMLQRELELQNKVEALHHDKLVYAGEKASFEAEKKSWELRKKDKEDWWKKEEEKFNSKTERLAAGGDILLGKIANAAGLSENGAKTLSGIAGENANEEEFTKEEKLIASIADNISGKNLVEEEILQVGIAVERTCEDIIKKRKAE